MDLVERKFIEVLGYHGSWDMKMALAKDLVNGTIKEEEIDKVLREKYPPSEP
jgi:DNA-binding MurR/RpiR family transcriptional regulator